MKKVLLLDGGVRHIALFFGLVFTTLNAMIAFGMFKSYFETGLVGEMAIAFIPILAVAAIAEAIQDIRNGKAGQKGGSIFSKADVVCYFIGGMLAVPTHFFLGHIMFFKVFAFALIAFAIYDYKTKYLQTKFAEKV